MDIKLDSEKTLFLVDGHNLIFRAYHGLKETQLSTRSGEPTGAIFGFTRMMLKLFKDFDPKYMVIAFDGKEKTFRHHLLESYKANRVEMPEDLVPQVAKIDELVKLLGLTSIVSSNGFEADDVIGALAVYGARNGYKVAIVSSDKDLCQLVSDRIIMLYIQRGLNDVEFRGSKEVEERYGVPPCQITDLLGLMGDASDNIPGVPRVGEKTAQKFLKQYPTIEQLLENIDKLGKAKVVQSLREHKNDAMLSKNLVTIETNINKIGLDISLKDLERQEIKRSELRKLFEELEFRQFIKELDIGVKALKKKADYKIVHKKEKLDELVNKLNDADVFAFDTESTSTDFRKAELVGLSFSVNPFEAYYIPVGHENDEDQLPLEKVLEAVKPFLLSTKKNLIGYNLKNDIAIMHQYGINIPIPYFDTMVASFLLDASRQAHNIDDLAKDFLQLQKMTFESLFDSRAEKNIAKVAKENAAIYACEEADFTLQLFERFKSNLEKLELVHLFDTIEMPLIPVLIEMERNGMLLDTQAMKAFEKELSAAIEEVEQKIHDEADDKEFNINSPKQLSDVLFEKLNYPTKGIKKLKQHHSTAEDVLRKLAKVDDPKRAELPKLLLEYRSLTKIKSTYVDGLLKQVNPETNRVHTTFNQTATETGRLSSSEPNLQNIPIREGTGKDFRRFFIASEGCVLLSADYSQVELRILAEIAGEESMKEAFRHHRDIHTETASKIFKKPPEEITKDMRRQAKTVNFGIDYGMTEFGLSERLDIPRKQAREFIEQYFATFPKIKEYIDNTVEETKQKGYTKTLLGRRRYFPDIHAASYNVRESAKRRAINMPIQGTAADIIKIAMIRLREELHKLSLKSKIILQVHDELLLEVPLDEVEQVKQVTKSAMESAFTLSIPLSVDVNTGQNWYEAH